MGVDRGKIMAGAFLYWVLVIMPTVALLLREQGWESPTLEHLFVGLSGLLAGNLIWQGIAVARQNQVQQPRYWAFNPYLVGVGVVVLYLAWFTNLANSLASGLKESAFTWPGGVIPLQGFWERVIETGITALGVLLLEKGVRSKRTMEERRMVRVQRQARRELKRQPNP